MPGTSEDLSKNGDKHPLSPCSVQLSIGWSVGHGPIAEQISWCQSGATSLATVGQCFIHSSWDGLNDCSQFKSSALRRLRFCDEEGLMRMINAFNVIFSRKAWSLHRPVLYHSDELLLRGMNPFSESRGESCFNQDLILFRTNKCSLKLQSPRHHILLIFVGLI